MYLLKNVGFSIAMLVYQRGPVFLLPPFYLNWNFGSQPVYLTRGFLFPRKATEKGDSGGLPKKGTMKISYNDAFFQEFFPLAEISSLWDFRITNPPKTWGEMKFALEKK